MTVAIIALLLFAGLIVSVLLAAILVAVNAKTTTGRVGAIVTGLLFLDTALFLM